VPVGGHTFTYTPSAGKYILIGSTKYGTEPTAGQLLHDVACGDVTGNLTLPTESKVLYNVQFGAAGTQYTGNVSLPNTGTPSATGDATLVLNTAYYGASNATAGTATGGGVIVVED
jgi:hypothetical protein